VEAAKELPARGVLKPPHMVAEKRFPGKFSAAPAVVVKIPVGLRMKPARWQLDCLDGRLPA
jgi:hypothetical protein